MCTKLNKDRKEIRLLSFSPTTSSGIQCDLQPFALDSAPPYDALSYVWGDPKSTAEVECCGISTPITANLFAALTALRTRSDIGWIWVDSLCINQSDPVEKAYQVPLMRQIYGRAGRVLSWLGEADGDVHLSFAAIERWAKAILSTSPALDNWPNGAMIRSAVTQIEQPLNEKDWAAIRALFRRTYWERVWIVQEVSLAQECLLVCGKHELDFRKLLWCYRTWISGDVRMPELDGLLRAATHRTQFYAFMRFSLESEDAGAGVSKNRKAGPAPTCGRGLARLPFLLKRASILSATDARDKIFGLLGLVSVQDLPIPVDYENTVGEAYTNAIRALIQHSERLDILAFAGVGSINQNPRDSLPSWVPDCRCREFDLRFCEDAPFYDIMLFNASANTKADCSFPYEDNNHVQIRGLMCDGISEIAEQNWSPEERMYRWVQFVLSNHERFKAYREHLLQILFRTVIVDHLWRGFDTPEFLSSHLEYEFCSMAAGFLTAVKYIYEGRALPDFRQGDEPVGVTFRGLNPRAKEILAKLLEGETKSSVDTELSLTALIESFLGKSRMPGCLEWPKNLDISPDADEANLRRFRFYLRMTDQRCLFITENGYMGVGPAKTEKGDKVFIPLGCCLPVSVREHGDAFELIGDTFVCGMMQGEMMLMTGPGAPSLEDIVLK